MFVPSCPGVPWGCWPGLQRHLRWRRRRRRAGRKFRRRRRGRCAWARRRGWNRGTMLGRVRLPRRDLRTAGPAGLRRRRPLCRAGPALHGGHRLRGLRRFVEWTLDLRPRHLRLLRDQRLPGRLQRRQRVSGGNELRQRSPLRADDLHGGQRIVPDRLYLRLRWALRSSALHLRHAMLRCLRRGRLLPLARPLSGACGLRGAPATVGRATGRLRTAAAPPPKSHTSRGSGTRLSGSCRRGGDRAPRRDRTIRPCR